MIAFDNQGMSLTYELSRKDGPVLAFFQQRLGNVAPIRKGFYGEAGGEGAEDPSAELCLHKHV